MPDEIVPFPINPPPGVVLNNSPSAISGRWMTTEHVRFVDGKPQKIGGYSVAVTKATFGVPRTLHAWRDNNSQEYIGVGTEQKLYVVDYLFALNNITPISSSGNLTNPFSTTSGSLVVSVAHTAHGRNVNDTVIFSGATAVGGLTIDGAFTVVTVTSANAYTISSHTGTASSTAGPGGGTVAYQYELAVGTDHGSYGFGYGTGTYGSSTYGTARSTTTFLIEPRIWSLDHFGQVLLASYNTGALYSWDPSAISALTTRAAIVTDAPSDIRAMFITPERFVIALCSEMNIKWCDQGDYTTWTPTVLNTAGIRGVTEGTKLVGGKSLGGGVSLLWSDAALYVHQFTGSSLVFDTRLGGKNCGLISPSAAITVGSVAYWMGTNKFFLFNGAVQPIPNVDDVRAYLFDQIDPLSGYLCAAMYVSKFNEVWFFVVVQGSTEPGLYAIVNLDGYSWSVGTLTRTAGTYFTHGDTRPYWADHLGVIYLHEHGNDGLDIVTVSSVGGAIAEADVTSTAAAIDAYCTVAPVGLDKGHSIMDVEGIEADFFEQSGDVTLTVDCYDRIRESTDTPFDTQSQTVGESDTLIDFRVSGRYAGMTVRSNTLGGYFRFGSPTAYIKEAGSRR